MHIGHISNRRILALCFLRAAMTDLNTLRLDCSTLAEFSPAIRRIQRALPPELQPRFVDILENYLLSCGTQGTFERLKNRTVAQIFAEYQPGNPEIIASGELDGVRYQLAKPPLPFSPEADSKAEGDAG
jgi:hypothetical protein